MATRKQVRQLRFDEIRSHLALSPDGKMLAVASSRWVYLDDPSTGKALGRLDTINSTNALAFSPDSRRLAVSVSREGVEIREIATKKVLKTLHRGWSFHSIAFSSDGKRLACSNGVETEIHDLEGKQAVVKSKYFCEGWQCLAFLRGDKWLAISRGPVFVVSTKTGKWIGMATDYQLHTSGIAVSRDGKLLASAGMKNNDISLWKLDEWDWKEDGD